jgi:small subunit ribosomal protein S20
MPNIRSAVKRTKTSERKCQANRSVKSRARTARTNLLEAVSNGNREEAEKLFRELCSVLDKAVKRGVLKANTAARRKSRAAARLAGLA